MSRHIYRISLAVGANCLTLHSARLDAQQVADTAFHPRIENPAYGVGKGPTVLVDEAHANFHTVTGRYLVFADLLRRDGFSVRALSSPLSIEALRAARALVIANATAAFSPAEVAVLHDWVVRGGSLLLITDHTPYSEAAEPIAASFGIRLRHGVANVPDNPLGGRLVFRRSDESLKDDSITKGIDSVATFTGTSFQLDSAGRPLLVFGPEVYSIMSRSDSIPVPVTGHFQGAVLSVSRGKVAVFGEAAMFSAQVTGPDRRPMGMNAPIASQNAAFVLNVVHWLTGVLR